MDWSAAQYTCFEAERNRPIHDLLAQVTRATTDTATDLGCGPGNSTTLLRQRFPGAAILGVDSSADMIAAARRRLPDVQFRITDIASWSRAGGRCDVILANASLQWVPDHATLFPALAGRLAPSGSLAIQMPDNLDEPAHRLMREIAADGPWAGTLRGAGATRTRRHDCGWYYRTLRESGVSVDVWRTVYHHPLAGPDAVVDWFRGSGLLPYLQRLDATGQAGFLDRYRRAIASAYPAQPDGCVLVPFPRLFLVATRRELSGAALTGMTDSASDP